MRRSGGSKSFIKGIFTPRPRWWVYPAVLLILLGIVEAILFTSVVVVAARMDHPEPADTMIILGAGINEQGIPKSTLQYRLDRAISLFEQGYTRAIIVTGAQGDDEPMPEAVAMKRYLVAKGIPPEVVYEEPNSFSTEENLANAKQIMEDNGFFTALVVTSDYHVWRALSLCEDLGIDASGAGALNAKTLRYRVQNCIRETGSWIKYWASSMLAPLHRGSGVPLCLFQIIRCEKQGFEEG